MMQKIGVAFIGKRKDARQQRYWQQTVFGLELIQKFKSSVRRKDRTG